MGLSRRQKLTVITLLVYWPVIFVLTHIPLDKVPRWITSISLSDVLIHYFVYMVLVFLLWFAISPDKKANWRGGLVWFVLLVVVLYGVFDEWLQAYTGRQPDFTDFLADFFGTFTGLILLSIFSFWPASLVVTGSSILVLTFMKANSNALPPAAEAAFHLFAYGFFSLLWLRYMYHLLPIRAPQLKWLIGAMVLPVGFLILVETFSLLAGGDFRLQYAVISAVGIAGVIVAILLPALFRRCFVQK